MTYLQVHFPSDCFSPRLPKPANPPVAVKAVDEPLESVLGDAAESDFFRKSNDPVDAEMAPKVVAGFGAVVVVLAPLPPPKPEKPAKALGPSYK